MSKYNRFLKLIRDNFSQLLSHGGFKQTTLEAYMQGKTKAKPITIIAIAEILGEDWQALV